MSQGFQQPEDAITLEDQEFLRSIGISGIPSGLERALQHYQAAMSAKDRIEDRADGLQALELDETDRRRLSRRQGKDTTQDSLRFFRDLSDLEGQEG